ncbi:MAG: hypothetical protein ACREXY_05100 [Gammaproteobacteria bacterium]
MPKKPAAVAGVCAVLALWIVPLAWAAQRIEYEGPKTWLAGWYAESVYDIADNRWYLNGFEKTTESWSLVTFIKPSGSWSCSIEAFSSRVECGYGLPVGIEDFQKKAYCKNTDPGTVIGTCYAWRNRF